MRLLWGLCALTWCAGCGEAFVLPGAPAAAVVAVPSGGSGALGSSTVHARSSSRQLRRFNTPPVGAEVAAEESVVVEKEGEGAITSAVSLRLYDIGNGMAPLISALLRKPFPHVWHTAIAAFGSEYWFSTHIEVMDLVDVEYAFGMEPIHTIDIGHTTRTQEEFEQYLHDALADEYCADKYDVFTHNCNHFANDVSNFLVGEPVPQHVLDISELALSEFGAAQTAITKVVSNRMARYVMVAWGRANRQGKDSLGVRRVFGSAAAASLSEDEGDDA